MNIHSSPQINRQLTASVATISNHGSLELTKGSLIEATVQRVADSLAWLNVEGKIFVARLEIPLQAKQQITLEVADVTSSQIKLRLAEDTTGLQSQTTSPIVTHNLETQLMSWGLEADDINLSITKTLLTHNQTINPTDIETVRALWRGLSSSISLSATEGAETIAHLFARQLPINKEAVSLAHAYLNRVPNISPQFTELRSTLSQAYNQIKQLSHPSLSQLSHLLETTLNQAASWMISADAPPAENAARLANLVATMGTAPESELANHLLQIKNPSSSGGSEGGTSPTVIIESSAMVDSPSLTILTSGRTPAAPPVTNPLYQLATAITKTLDAVNDGSLDIDQAETQTLHRLVRQLDSVSNTLGAMQLSNLGHTPNLAAEPYYLFPIPLATPDGSHTAHLKIYRQPGHNTIDPDNLRLALLLDLPELGQMAINLSIHQSERYLNGQILSGREQTHHLASTELNQLHDQLAALGYRVGTLTTGLLEANDPLTITNDATQLTPISLTQINVRA
ncbi:MAG TPA: hypothetical protein P5526_07860 [Anaerolineae bacterium]|nr:hypothetical protein [Anaerolineae bacterium]